MPFRDKFSIIEKLRERLEPHEKGYEISRDKVTQDFKGCTIEYF